MAEVIKMPRLSDTMEEGTIVDWFKSVGDDIAQGDVLAEVETDKANMELESFFEGKLLYVGVENGDTVPVDQVIAVVGEEGEDYQQVLDEAKGESQESKAEEETSEKATSDKDKAAQSEKDAAPEKAEPSPETKDSAKTEKGRIKASPLAKKLAEEKSIDLSAIEGTGDNGRIIKRDIERVEKEGAPQAKEKTESAPAGAPVSEPIATGEEDYEDVPLSQMRKTIAKRLVESKFSAPHFYLTMEINMDQAIEARKRINEVAEVKTSFNDLIIKASSLALRKNPKANASWLGDKIRYYKHIHMGVAVAVDDGLVVPVIRHADQKGVVQIARESQDYAEKAHNKQLQPEDYEGNTFSISNLGMYGIDQFTAIINPPDSCILAVGKIKKQPVVNDGELQETNVMTVTLSCDHRSVDGAIGSGFLKTFKENMEDPLRMIM